MKSLSVQHVLQIVRLAQTNVSPAELPGDSDLRMLRADSLDMMTILFDVQERTGVEIPDSQIESLRTPQAIVELVRSARPSRDCSRHLKSPRIRLVYWWSRRSAD